MVLIFFSLVFSRIFVRKAVLQSTNLAGRRRCEEGISLFHSQEALKCRNNSLSNGIPALVLSNACFIEKNLNIEKTSLYSNCSGGFVTKQKKKSEYFAMRVFPHHHHHQIPKPRPCCDHACGVGRW